MPGRLTALLGLAVAALFVWPHGAIAQTAIAVPNGVPVRLESASGGDPFPAAALDPAALQSPAVVTTNVGFSYLRPHWATGGLNLRAAAAGNSAVTIIDPFGDLSGQFGFVPRVDLQYDAASLGFAVAASAQFISLGGNLERTVVTSAGSADLLATSDLTFLIVNIAEIASTVRAADLMGHPLFGHFAFEHDTYGLSVGTRYVSVRQAWNASLRTGDATLASAAATATFAGLGLTTAVSADHPCSERWGLYSNLRGSLLIGPRNRKSVTTGTDAGGAFSNSLVENTTELIPTAELECGVRYLAPFDPRRSATDGTGPILSIRVGFVGQCWGKLGLLQAAPGAARFDNRPLYLVGLTLLAGVEF